MERGLALDLFALTYLEASEFMCFDEFIFPGRSFLVCLFH